MSETHKPSNRLGISFLYASSFIWVLVAATAAQDGGKAEPGRIQFAKGRTSTVLSASLANSEEMEFVFTARKAQKVTILNSNPRLFDVRIFSKEFDTETEFDSSRTFSIELASTCDYMLYVRKKIVERPRRARFNITVSIR